MITVPTGDLVGILSDVIPFASTDEDDEILRSVRIEWDGKAMHTLATDRYRLAWSTWDPNDDHEEEHQDSLFTDWGGADNPWAATIGLYDAKHLVKTYKLGAKELWVPLTVEAGDRVVKVVRQRDSGHSAITTVAADLFITYPDLRALLANNDIAVPTDQLQFTAKYLADFAKVRPRGPLSMMLTGPHGLVHITIGERFVGAIQPVRGS